MTKLVLTESNEVAAAEVVLALLLHLQFEDALDLGA